uniref:Uncharacterized protein n=1 Tax=Onchocerca volvulus TaxID=6282 RepID=A0A8R1Y9I5_ONCVO
MIDLKKKRYSFTEEFVSGAVQEVLPKDERAENESIATDHRKLTTISREQLTKMISFNGHFAVVGYEKEALMNFLKLEVIRVGMTIILLAWIYSFTGYNDEKFLAISNEWLLNKQA